MQLTLDDNKLHPLCSVVTDPAALFPEQTRVLKALKLNLFLRAWKDSIRPHKHTSNEHPGNKLRIKLLAPTFSAAPVTSLPLQQSECTDLERSSTESPSNLTRHQSPEQSARGGSPSSDTRKASRTRTGCLTCRIRKKKCGEERPSCSACNRLGLECQYPHPELARKNKKRRRKSEASPVSSPTKESKEDSVAVKKEASQPTSAPERVPSATPSPILCDQDSQQAPDSESHHGLEGIDADASEHKYAIDSSEAASTETEITLQKAKWSEPSPELEASGPSDDFIKSEGFVAPFEEDHMVASEDNKMIRHQPEDKYKELYGFRGGLSRTTSFEDLFTLPFDTFDILNTGMFTPAVASPVLGFSVPNQHIPPNLLGFAPPDFSFLPLPSSSGQSDLNNVYPEIDQHGRQLFEYFCNTQSNIMSVSPQNNFKKVFARMALSSRPVLCGVLAWAAFHRNSSREDLERGTKYVEEASMLIRNDNHGAHSNEETLAALLLMASAQICSGDVTKWRQYLVLAASVIKKHGGVSAFMDAESVAWLLKNYAYHEILSSSSRQFPPLLSTSDLKIIMHHTPGDMPDTLCACCQPVLTILAVINHLSREVRNITGDKGSNVSLPAIQRVNEQAADLEQQIYKVKPDREVLMNLSGDESKLQIVLFEAFQHLSILYLYDAVLHMNSSSLQIRSINELLLNTIDILMGTRVEGILTFPLFIAGVTCCVESTRPSILKRFEQMFARNQARNIRQACTLLREVWAMDDLGTKHVDWNLLAENKGWHLSFA